MGVSSAIRAGQAYIELYLERKGFTAGLADATKQVGGFARKIGGLASSFAGVAGIGGLGGIGLALGSIKKYADVGSQLKDMSDRTGIAVEELSTLKFAATQAGSSLEGLETGVKFMQKLISSAEDGGSEAVTTLQKLGITLADLRGKTPDEQLKVFADVISQIDSDSDRTTATLKVFGKAGTDLLPLLREGGRGIDELQAKARALGLEMSTQDAKAAEELGDKIDELKLRAESFASSVGKNLLPMLVDMVTFAAKSARAFNLLRDAIVESRIEGDRTAEANSKTFEQRMEANARGAGWKPSKEDPAEIAKEAAIKAKADATALAARIAATPDRELGGFGADKFPGLSRLFSTGSSAKQETWSDTLGLGGAAKMLSQANYLAKGDWTGQEKERDKYAKYLGLFDPASYGLTAKRDAVKDLNDLPSAATGAFSGLKKAFGGVGTIGELFGSVKDGVIEALDNGSINKHTTSTAGTFNGAYAALQLGTGKTDEQQLEEQKKANALLDRIERKKGGLIVT